MWIGYYKYFLEQKASICNKYTFWTWKHFGMPDFEQKYFFVASVGLFKCLSKVSMYEFESNPCSIFWNSWKPCRVIIFLSISPQNISTCVQCCRDGRDILKAQAALEIKENTIFILYVFIDYNLHVFYSKGVFFLLSIFSLLFTFIFNTAYVYGFLQILLKKLLEGLWEVKRLILKPCLLFTQ